MALIIPAVFGVSFYRNFEKMYDGRIYPGVSIDGMAAGGKTASEIEDYFRKKNKVFDNLDITLGYGDRISTVSGDLLKAGYDGKLSATQAYLIGRSGNRLSDLYQKWQAGNRGLVVKSVLSMDENYLDETVNYMAEIIDMPAEDALFKFENGLVKTFKLSKDGLKLDREKTKTMIISQLAAIGRSGEKSSGPLTVDLPVAVVEPEVTTDKANNLGIKELVGSGSSKFAGSIPGRIHNIELAASRIAGHLIKPGETFSFNDALGDISAATGYQQAYIIKEGRTVLGDGGGVCQVSTTLFRAAMSAGLPIEERHAHAYRVHYYEEDAGPGIDATVFSPSVDLKFVNDTPEHLLIQMKIDKSVPSLVFDIYGTSDGRKADITEPVIYSQTPPPPPLYQDDPTLAPGAVKQVDWAAWGARVSFNYKVTRDGEEIYNKEFYSNFRPWQAVYLRGPSA